MPRSYDWSVDPRATEIRPRPIRSFSGRRSIGIDLKAPAGAETLLTLAEDADVLIEGFRPGVVERLGIGPQACLERNPRLVYGRMTGWGQKGPLAHAAGHDINYVALSSALHLIGPPDGKPTPPLNVVGDFGGGGMLLAVGVLGALLESRRTGRGQVVDAAIVDGAISLLAMFFGFRADGLFRDATGANLLAGAAPYYDTYRTADDRYVAVGALEPRFLALLIEKLDLDPGLFDHGAYPAFDSETVHVRWPAMREHLARAFLRRTRAEWEEVFDGTDACVSPVLSLDEAARHPHHLARGSFIEVGGVLQNAPAPRFSRTAPAAPRPPRRPGQDTDAVLLEHGFTKARIEELRRCGAVT